MKYYRARLMRLKKNSQRHLDFFFKAPSLREARLKVRSRYPDWVLRGVNVVGRPSISGDSV